MKERICIVGSGPSGAISAYVAVTKGYDVIMLDTGIEPDTGVRSLIENPCLDTESFSNKVREFRKKTLAGHKGIPEKLAFGSSFPYDIFPGGELNYEKGTDFVISYAYGGLSNVWGATVAALHPDDVADWPVSVEEFNEHFLMLNEVVEVSSGTDHIDKLYPVQISQGSNYALGGQAQMLLDNLNCYGDELLDQGIYFGRAKIALGKKYSTNKIGCVQCGMCMHGCPHNVIFSSKDVINKYLLNAPNFKYLKGCLVNRFQEESNIVRIYYRDSEGKSDSIEASRLFLAAGVFGSTSIVSRSTNWQKKSFKIKDSQKYLFPFILNKRLPKVARESTNTLSQIYFDFKIPGISNYIVHMQLYAYNELVLEPFRRFLPDKIVDQFPKYFAFFFDRLMIGMIYLNGVDSGQLEFFPNREGNSNSLGKVTGNLNPKGRDIFKKVRKLISKESKKIGGSIPFFGISEIPAGKSQHFGSSIPMSANPEEGTSDTLGRPFGCNLVHVVDASVLPSVPGTPTTYPIMANAARITKLALEL